ncbi:ABC transporter permease subunit [Candidatus Aerophobetes bacterium]|nr:ABC transporter permease subunit [Candidatus Aerophobetes bacterium]
MKILAKRELLSSLYGWGLYIAIFISFLVSSFILKNFLQGIRENNIFISSYPLNFPLFTSVVIISLYLVIVSAISISREREQGTLEVLFYGPVSSFSFLMGKYITDMLLYFIILGFFAIYFLGVSLLTNLGFTIALVKAFVVSIFLASCVISFGLFISSLTGKVRSSIVWLIGILLAFLGIWFLQNIFLRIPSEALSSWMRYLQKTIGIIYHFVNWVSPFSYLSRGMESIWLGSLKPFLLNILYSVLYTVILLALSVHILRAKGVRA